MTAGVYRITNIANGKSYIGISNNIERRWKYEIRGASIDNGVNSAIEKAIRKYGEEASTSEARNQEIERTKWKREDIMIRENGYSR